MNRHEMLDIDGIRRYIEGGHGTFTIVSNKTGARFTYRLNMPKDAPKVDERNRPVRKDRPLPIFVSVLTGPDNTRDHRFIGTIWIHKKVFSHSLKSKIGYDAPSVAAFRWFYLNLSDHRVLDFCEVWHEGKCGVCGRKLTVPESIERGMGPVCYGKTA